jgi:apoptosis-inducing factor 3
MEKMDSPALPDLSAGILIQDIPDGAIVQGRMGSDPAILLRRGDEFFAVGAQCTHYHGALAAGLVVNDTIRCPLHHACFSLRTGEALRAPALDPIACWRVERSRDKIFVREKLPEPKPKALGASASSPPASVIIVGGGAAGLAAADMLRREGYSAPISVFSADDSPPYDRPNLSKDFLSGDAPAEWLPLRGIEYYSQRNIELMLNARVAAIDTQKRRVVLADGRHSDFGALLLATGADPVHLDIACTNSLPIYYLRSFKDSRSLLAAAGSAKTVVVVGASFIGLEVAASLRQRGLKVHVVGPEHVPLERVMGAQVGAFVRELHESHGVMFHLGASVARVDGHQVTLTNAAIIDADFLVLGVGVRPTVTLAEQAGLRMDRGILVDQYLETSVPGIFAAGDVARWPDVHSGDRIRVEHWVVAERQGQIAALNILGRRQAFAAVPFFWSQHYDCTINYVGHAESWDELVVDGSIAAKDCTVTYKRTGRILAVATIARDLASLKAECELESTQVRIP